MAGEFEDVVHRKEQSWCPDRKRRETLTCLLLPAGHSAAAVFILPLLLDHRRGWHLLRRSGGGRRSLCVVTLVFQRLFVYVGILPGGDIAAVSRMGGSERGTNKLKTISYRIEQLLQTIHSVDKKGFG